MNNDYLLKSGHFRYTESRYNDRDLNFYIAFNVEIEMNDLLLLVK